MVNPLGVYSQHTSALIQGSTSSLKLVTYLANGRNVKRVKGIQRLHVNRYTHPPYIVTDTQHMATYWEAARLDAMWYIIAINIINYGGDSTIIYDKSQVY